MFILIYMFLKNSHIILYLSPPTIGQWVFLIYLLESSVSCTLEYDDDDGEKASEQSASVSHSAMMGQTTLGSLGKVCGLLGSLGKVGGLLGSLGKVCGLLGSLGKVCELLGSLGKVCGLLGSLGKVCELLGSLGKVCGLIYIDITLYYRQPHAYYLALHVVPNVY